MIQLSYQPALDPFHTIFRDIRILLIDVIGEIEFDKLRILDFYLAFPYRISAIRLKPEHRKFARLAKAYDHKRGYVEQPADRILFARMEPVQEAAAQTLAEAGTIDSPALERGVVIRGSQAVRPDLSERAASENAIEGDLVEFLGDLAKYPLLGQGGLKDRTGLMDFRYDAI